ncbi:MAG: amidohydrolase [Oscillospiraceae bacterium]|nr:amidohydrolase [Oscillospiraceae bacterium]
MSIYGDAARKSISRQETELVKISEKLWELAETKFEEYESAALLCQALEWEGFQIEQGVGGLPTAFRAVWESPEGRGPVIGFLGEYDALPGLSQEAGALKKVPRGNASNSNGHGCGHHLLGTALLGAAAALREYIMKNALPGTVVYYGCPAEEGGSGKVWMLRTGIFDEADALFSWHPDCINRVSPNDVLATVCMRYDFHGIASHAALAPHLGRSALEAVELMNVGMGFLREHIDQQARVHYAVGNAGGPATNIVQPEASVSYQIRAPHISQAHEITERINDLARGAAIMTGTRCDICFERATSELRVSETLNDLLFDSMQELGFYTPDSKDQDEAARIYATLPEASRGNTAQLARLSYDKEGDALVERMKDTELLDFAFPRHAEVRRYGASSDVGDVSLIRPLGFMNAACYVKDLPLHSWQAVASGKTRFAQQGMLSAARILAAAAMRLASESDMLESVRSEFAAQTARAPYVCVIPADAKPPIKAKK